MRMQESRKKYPLKYLKIEEHYSLELLNIDLEGEKKHVCNN